MEFEKQPLAAESNDVGMFPVHLRLGAQQQANKQFMSYPDFLRLSAQRLEHELPGSAVKRVCQIELRAVGIESR